MEKRYYVTEAGISAGWKAMHSGGFCQGADSRYVPRDSYTAATFPELDAAVEAGFLRSEWGHYEHVGGILRNWIPAVFVVTKSDGLYMSVNVVNLPVWTTNVADALTYDTREAAEADAARVDPTAKVVPV